MRTGCCCKLSKVLRRVLVSGANGSSLLWAIGALVLLSVVGATVALMSPSALQSKLEQEAGMRAYYNANAGLNYILGAQQAAQLNGTNASDFLSQMGGGSVVSYDFGASGKFSYKLGNLITSGSNGTYQVTSLVGSVENSSGGDAYGYVVYGGGKGNSAVMNYTVSSYAQKGLYNNVEVYSGIGLAIGNDAVLDSNVMAANITIGNNANIAGSVVGNTFVKTNGFVTIGGDICSNGYVETSDSSIYKGNIYAQGYVKIISSVRVYGSVYAGDYVTVGNAAIISHDINSGSYVSLTGGTSPLAQTVNVKANGNIVFNGGSTDKPTMIGGTAYANKIGEIAASINLGSAAKVPAAYAVGDISLGSSASVTGVACCGGSLSLGWNATVGSQCSTFSESDIVTPTAPTKCTILTAPKHADTSNFPAASTSLINVAASSSGTTLAPGTYGTVSSNWLGKLYLSAGTYHFNKLDLTGDQTKLYLDVSGGDITIFVTDTVKLSNLFSVYITGKNPSTGTSLTNASVSSLISAKETGIAAKVYLETMKTVNFGNKNTWIGTIYAEGTINLSNQPVILGALYSRSGTVDQVNSQSLYFVMSDYAANNWVPE